MKWLSMSNIQVVKTIDEALELAYKICGYNPKTYIMPHGANTLPKIITEDSVS